MHRFWRLLHAGPKRLSPITPRQYFSNCFFYNIHVAGFSNVFLLLISYIVTCFSLSLVFLPLYYNYSLVPIAMGYWSIDWSYTFAVLPFGYTTWSCWSHCDASCGDKVQSRERSCTNPPPSLPGYNCSALGPSIEVRQCYGPTDHISKWIYRHSYFFDHFKLIKNDKPTGGINVMRKRITLTFKPLDSLISIVKLRKPCWFVT